MYKPEVNLELVGPETAYELLTNKNKYHKRNINGEFL